MIRIGPALAVVFVAGVAAAGPALGAFPGENGKIAFDSDRRGGDSDVWTMDPDGGNLLRSPDTQDAAKAGQWGRVSDMLLPDTQDAAKAGQPASAINMQSPDTQDAAEGVRRNGAKARAATYANIRSLPPKVRPRP